MRPFRWYLVSAGVLCAAHPAHAQHQPVSVFHRVSPNLPVLQASRWLRDSAPPLPRRRSHVAQGAGVGALVGGLGGALYTFTHVRGGCTVPAGASDCNDRGARLLLAGYFGVGGATIGALVGAVLGAAIPVASTSRAPGATP